MWEYLFVTHTRNRIGNVSQNTQNTFDGNCAGLVNKLFSHTAVVTFDINKHYSLVESVR